MESSTKYTYILQDILIVPPVTSPSPLTISNELKTMVYSLQSTFYSLPTHLLVYSLPTHLYRLVGRHQRAPVFHLDADGRGVLVPWMVGLGSRSPQGRRREGGVHARVQLRAPLGACLVDSARLTRCRVTSSRRHIVVYCSNQDHLFDNLYTYNPVVCHQHHCRSSFFRLATYVRQ